MAPLILLAVLFVVAACAALSVYGAYRRHFAAARFLAVGAASVVAGYTGLLAVVNVTQTHPHEIPAGVALPFCGFYLDCHLSATVVGVSSADSLGQAPWTARARDRFHIVTLRIASNARQATLRLGAPEVWLVDRNGRRRDPSPLADSVLRAHGEHPPGLDAPVPPGASFTTAVVFDLPDEAAPFRLRIREGALPDRIFEQLLLWDDDGLFAHPSWFAMR